MRSNYSFAKRNGLSIVLLALMFFSLAGQFIAGYHVHNDELKEHNAPEIDMGQYFVSGHFMQATFENWESEFLQMALYVMLTVHLYQVGSAESKAPDKKEEVDREPKPGPDSPWAVNKGCWWLRLYKYSLSIAFVILFLVSFAFHFYGSFKNYNKEQMLKGLPQNSWSEHLSSSQFWFESFQNWQSEFLAVASIVILTIWLRQQGSPESKPVDAAHSDTGR